jgi:hypothetical protein
VTNDITANHATTENTSGDTTNNNTTNDTTANLVTNGSTTAYINPTDRSAGWVSEESWRLIDQRASLRKRGTSDTAQMDQLNTAIQKASGTTGKSAHYKLAMTMRHC